MVNRLCYSFIVLNILLASVILCNEERTSSLTFVIDTTVSMQSDIKSVQRRIESILDVVFNSKNSPIGVFNIVTFKADAQLLIRTRDREEFKKILNSIKAHGGGACPEITFTGIERGLRESEKDSYVLVFTDAISEDNNLYEKVKNLALNLNNKIIFLLTTNSACSNDSVEIDKFYIDLADSTGGQVFRLNKKNFPKIMAYINLLAESRKTELEKTKFPPGYNNTYNYTLDSGLSGVTLVVTGKVPKVQVKGPSPENVVTKTIVDDHRSTIICDLKIKKPGDLYLELGSQNETEMTLLGTTNINFGYGFSVIKPTSLNGTTNRPVPGHKSHVVIKVNSTGEKFNLTKIEIVHVNGSVIAEYPMHTADFKEQFYISDPINTPNDTFKIKIVGVKESTREKIVRRSNPVEVQKIVDAADNKPPLVSIMGEPKIQINYGDPLQLQCIVSGYPEPNITWEDESGSPLNFTVIPKKLPYDYISILEIDQNTESHTFSCKASNQLDSQVKSVKVEIKGIILATNISKGSVPQLNIVSESKIPLNYGEPLKLKCVVTGYPKPNITWEDETKSPLNSAVLSKNLEEYISTLHIDRMTQSNTFSCKASNNLGSKIKSFKADMHSFIEAVDISKDKTIEYDTEHVLHCKVKASPPANITWHLNGKQIEKDEDMSLSPDKFSFIIKHMKPKFSGKFTCEVKNNFITKVYTINLSISGIDSPKIDKKITQMIVESSNSVKILCRIIKGYPKPTIQWYFKKENEKDFYEIEEYREILHIEKTTANDAGSYKCSAKNEISSDSHTIHLEIKEPVTIVMPEETSFNVTVGKSLALECPIKESPTTKIKWRFDSKEKHDKNIDAETKLEFRRIQFNESGFYTCYAETIKGLVNITYSINVIAPPAINAAVKKLSCVVGDLVLKIPCPANGNPKPNIAWYQKGQLLATGTEWYDVDEVGTLLIKNVDSTHAGAYVCIAKNDFGEASENFRVIVEKFPVPEKIRSEQLEYIEKGKSKELKCGSQHKPTDLVRWYQDNRVVQTGTLLIRNFVGMKKYVCRVSNFGMPISVRVRCRLGNKPRFSKIKLNLGPRAFLDEDRLLSCAASATPRPRVTWLFNGKVIPNVKTLYYTYEESVSSIGQYECIVENLLGKISRIYNVTVKDCALSIETDFDRHHPLTLIGQDVINKIKIKKGLMIVPDDVSLNFFCPGGFNMSLDTEIQATCLGNKLFNINGKRMEYPDLKCVEEFMPSTERTGVQCDTTDTEIILIGMTINKKFEQVYKICFDKTLNIPRYAQYNLTKLHAGVRSKNKHSWFNSDIINYDVTEIFDCKRQKEHIANTFGITTDDDCCYARRKLVNEKDLYPGYPQITTYSYLNIIPHWSSCSMANWNAIEDKLRNHAKWCRKKCLEITTGISQHLNLPIGKRNVPVYIKDTSDRKMILPVLLWKVIIDLNTRESIVVIQINIPGTFKRYVPKQSPCKNICNEIEWMKTIDITDEKKGVMICCATWDFERNFDYRKKFSRGIYVNPLKKLNT